MPPLDIQTIQTHTTEAKALLSYDQVVETLGLRVGIEAGLKSNVPGATVTVDWQTPGADGNPSGALVHVVVDHNFVAPEATPADGAPGAGDASLKSDAPAQPVVPPTPGTGGLQIPGATTS